LVALVVGGLIVLIVFTFRYYSNASSSKTAIDAPLSDERKTTPILKASGKSAPPVTPVRKNQPVSARRVEAHKIAIPLGEGAKSSPIAAPPPQAVPVSAPVHENQSATLPQSGKHKIFLSYRREDSADVAGRIYDRLSHAFEKGQVYKDVDSIRLGVDFRKHVQKTVESCDVLLAVVGDRWLTAADASGRRIDNPKDFVRLEIEVALQRDIPVIPLLVRGADVPQESELPPVLASLSYRNGMSVRPDPDFHRDMDRLIQSLRELLDGGATPT